jgi:BirA family biotin operon repressor/biotin-[acetyl-CoA-carboxylase] ligase
MIGRTIIELDRVDSTNSYAGSLLRKGDVEEGLVISAFEQFAGKGQGSNSWQTEPGKNLTFSVVLHPVFLDPSEQFMLNKAVSLAVASFMRSYLDDISIKWPNDICAGTGKIAGILMEHYVSGGILETTVAGIGINLNQAHHTQDIPNPVSLIQLLQKEISLRDALESLCHFLDEWYAELKSGHYGLISATYARLLLGAGEWRDYRSEGRIFQGKIRDVDQFGRLLVRTRDDKVQIFSHREIEFIL